VVRISAYARRSDVIDSYILPSTPLFSLAVP